MKNKEEIIKAKEFVQSKFKIKTDIAVILGSGLGSFVDCLTEKKELDYKDIPLFPASHVPGHKGKLILGNVSKNVSVIAMQGRYHYYEHADMEKVSFPVRMLGLLGIKNLIVTNAAGGINRRFKPGDLMIIDDHINLMGVNPLCGPNDEEFGPRFPDMTEAYNKELRTKAYKAAIEQGIDIKSGVYAALSGPTYETPAEIGMLERLGADATGMSTVPEVIIANHMGMKVCGISCITNMAAGIKNQKLNHEEVIATTKKVQAIFAKFVARTIELIAQKDK